MTDLLAIAIVLSSTGVQPAEPDALFATAAACSTELDAPVAFSPAQSTEANTLATGRERRSFLLAVEARVNREDASQRSVVAARTERRTSSSRWLRVRLESPGRAWPFALAATADAATTYWALRRGGTERNPLLAFGRLDLGMVKIVQFPLLAKAIDSVEGRRPRLGRRLRWATLVFQAALALNNVRMGRSAGELGLDARPRARP